MNKSKVLITLINGNNHQDVRRYSFPFIYYPGALADIRALDNAHCVFFGYKSTDPEFRIKTKTVDSEMDLNETRLSEGLSEFMRMVTIREWS